MSFVRWLIAVIVIAALAHGAALYFGPSLIMSIVMGRASAVAGVNAMAYPPRPTASNNTVVRSSPDLLYSICVYDVSAGPLELSATVPPDTYWSAAFYDFNTNNYRVLNDSQVGRSVAIVLTKAGSPAAQALAGAETVVSPTDRGLILIRTLISNEAALPALEASRKDTTCSPLRK